MSAIKLENVP